MIKIAKRAFQRNRLGNAKDKINFNQEDYSLKPLTLFHLRGAVATT